MEEKDLSDIHNPEEVGRFTTELGAEVILTTEPHLGNGLMFHVRMQNPGDLRHTEVYLNDDVISQLTGAFAGHLLNIAFAPLKEILESHELEGDDEK